MTIPVSRSFDFIHWVLDLSKQPVSCPSFSRRRTVQDGYLADHWGDNVRAMVSWESWWLAIFLPLRHGFASVDVSTNGQQRTSENLDE